MFYNFITKTNNDLLRNSQEKLITKMTHLSDTKTTILNNNIVREAYQNLESKKTATRISLSGNF